MLAIWGPARPSTISPGAPWIIRRDHARDAEITAARQSYEALPRIEQIKHTLTTSPDCRLARALEAYADSINSGDTSKRPATYRDEHMLAMDAALKSAAEE